VRVLILAAVVLLLSCCAALGLKAPQDLDQGIAYAYGGVTGALTTIATATNAGQLTSAQATNANNLVLNVKSILDSARALETTNVAGAQTDLQLALTALQGVQTYLSQKGVKSP
jgi:hypothetical protein